MNQQTVLVTGGTGFVAGWCIVELLQRGYAVRASLRDLAKEPAARAAVASGGASPEHLTCVAADLTRDAGWDEAIAGCDFALHIASPLGGAADLIEPARDGTLRVLRAAANAGVKRIVMTSAAATARTPAGSSQVSDESVWADPNDPRFDAYRSSKALAERAAWDFATSLGKREMLTTILPSAVFGPLLAGQRAGSVRVIQSLLQGRPPGLPRFGFWVVDVRDLAALHVRALTSSAAAGERFLAAGEFLWLEEIAHTLRAELGDRAPRIPKRRLPDAVVRMIARFAPALRGLTADLGRRNELSAEKARRVLGFAPRPARATLVDCAESLLAREAAR